MIPNNFTLPCRTDGMGTVPCAFRYDGYSEL